MMTVQKPSSPFAAEGRFIDPASLGDGDFLLRRTWSHLARNCLDRERLTRRLCGVKQPRVP
jgi:hypothetical protein